MKHPASTFSSIRQPILVPLLGALAFATLALFPRGLNARSQSASIRATASVAQPLGVTGFSNHTGRFMLAPRNTSAYIFVESSGNQYATTLRANDHGFIAIDYLNNKLINELFSKHSTSEPSLLTIILTEN